MPLYQVYCHHHPSPVCGTLTVSATAICDTPQEAAQLFFRSHQLYTGCNNREALVQALDGEQLLFSVDLPTRSVRILSANGEPLLIEGETVDRESGAVPRGTSAPPPTSLSDACAPAPSPLAGHSYQYQPGSHDRPVDEPHEDDDPTFGARLHVVERDNSNRITRYTDAFDQADMFDQHGAQLTARDAFAVMAAAGCIQPYISMRARYDQWTDTTPITDAHRTDHAELHRARLHDHRVLSVWQAEYYRLLDHRPEIARRP